MNPQIEKPLTKKMGFGYRGFGGTSIMAAIPKHEITRPIAAANRVIHPKVFDNSTKVPTGKDNVIKPLPGTKNNLDDFKPKPFRARPVPSHHYKEPFRPKLPSQKVRQRAKKEETHPVAVSRIFHSIVDPILHKPDDDEIIEEPVEAEAITENVLKVSETAEPPFTVTHKTDTQPEVKSVDVQPEGEPDKSDDGVEDSAAELDVTSTRIPLQSFQKPDVITPLKTLNGPDAFTNDRSDTVDIPEVEKGEKKMNLQDGSDDIVDGVSSSDYRKTYLQMMELVKPRRKPNVIGITKKQMMKEKEAGKLPLVNHTPGFGSKAERIRRAQEKKKLKLEKPNAVENPV